MMGHWATVLFALATMAATADREVSRLSSHHLSDGQPSDGHLSVGQLSVGQKFEIRTADRVYRGELLDPDSGACQLATSADGARFGPQHKVYLLGATAGPQQRQTLVLMHEVKVGLKMELGIGDLEARHRQFSSEVKTIKLTD